MDDVKCIEQTDGHATEAKVLYVFYVKKRMYIMTKKKKKKKKHPIKSRKNQIEKRS